MRENSELRGVNGDGDSDSITREVGRDKPKQALTPPVVVRRLELEEETL